MADSLQVFEQRMSLMFSQTRETLVSLSCSEWYHVLFYAKEIVVKSCKD
jgi:hypothetical protein